MKGSAFSFGGGHRFISALLLLSASAAIISAATAIVSVTNSGREDESLSFYAGANEFLDIDYTAGTPSRVSGSGKISTGNTQQWVVWAKDGSRREGTISEAEIPLWIIDVEWAGSMEAEALHSGSNSKHRALAGQYAVVRGDLAGSWGQEYDVFCNLRNPAADYTFPVVVEDVEYTFNGSKKYDGSFKLVPGGPFITASATILGSGFDFRLYNRGWMALTSNANTTSVETKINENSGQWEGQADAWDLGTNPATWIDTFPIS